MMTALRSLLFNLVFFLWTVICLLILLPTLPMRHNVSWRGARFWSRSLLWLLQCICGLSYRIEGRENLPPGPCILASKHQSAWDTIVYNLVVERPAFVLKRELLAIPLFGGYMRHYGMIAIDRGGGTKALKAMLAAAKQRVADGRALVIFPEGTRTAPGSERPYHPGVSALYKALGVPVVPVALNSGCFWPRRAFLKRPGTIVLRLLPPIPPGLPRQDFEPRLKQAIERDSRELAAMAETQS
jgi:1-acyl-sn-glycerol-3-phosphate acyltransferase